MSDAPTEEETKWAERRTDWAEDRTMLANERTFGSWMRTGLATMALGLGFHAIFQKIEPVYLAKGIATLFIVIGLIIFILAFRSARRVGKRLESHAVEPLGQSYLGFVTFLFISGGIALAVIMWLL